MHSTGSRGRIGLSRPIGGGGQQVVGVGQPRITLQSPTMVPATAVTAQSVQLTPQHQQAQSMNTSNMQVRGLNVT